jgi:predicted nucleic acid-binding protein
VQRVTLDTNIYVSAFQFGGKPAEIIQMAMDGEIEVAISQPIIDETLRVLRVKFGWVESDLDGMLATLELSTRRVESGQASEY